MPLYLVRHAKAGEKRSWNRPDELRPLSRAGRRQSEALVGLLRDEKLTSLVSSPAVRCVQTLEALAAVTGLPVEIDQALEVDGDAADAIGLVRVADDGTVICTHGEVLRHLLERLAGDDGFALDERFPCKKGSVWLLERRGGVVRAATYWDAPR